MSHPDESQARSYSCNCPKLASAGLYETLREKMRFDPCGAYRAIFAGINKLAMLVGVDNLKQRHGVSYSLTPKGKAGRAATHPAPAHSRARSYNFYIPKLLDVEQFPAHSRAHLYNFILAERRKYVNEQ